MRISTHCLFPALALASIAITMSGCSSFLPSISEPEDLAAKTQARMTLIALAGQNEKLTSFKGLGKIKVWQDGVKKIDERIAWIGSEPNKLSLVILISGHPTVRMASDGKWFYYYESRQDEPVYQKRPASEVTLQRLVSIPIKTSDIVQLLAGRTPIREHHTARLNRQSSGPGYVLSLKKRWWGIVEKVFLDKNKTQVQQIEFFNRSGSLIYRAHLDETQMIEGYQVPARLRISGEEGIGFELEIIRYIVNAPVSSSMFVLKPPE
jgi:hypothetical protein